MSGAAKVNFNVHNLTDTVVSTVEGINFVQGRSIRGPWGDPKDIITSWPAFVRIYGGLHPNLEAPSIVKRLLEKGGSVRFSRVGHYEDITDRESLTASKANLTVAKELTVTGLGTGQTVKVVVGTLDSTFTSTGNVGNDMETIATTIENLAPVMADVKSTTTGGGLISVTNLPSGTLTIAVTDTAAQPTVTSTLANAAAVELPFTLGVKEAGEDGNNLIITVAPGSSGLVNSFDITVSHKTDSIVKETYPNITIPNTAYTDASAPTTYLKDIINNSVYITASYNNLVGELPVELTEPVILTFSGGSDGDEPVATDYIGDSNSNTGLHALNDYNDSYYLATLGIHDNLIDIAGASYANNRKDLFYFIRLEGKTKEALIAERENLNIDNKYVIFYGPSTRAKNALTDEIIDMDPIGDVLALANASDTEFGPWYSFAGPNRGTLTDVLGVNVNYGTPAKSKDLDELANRQINMVINRNGATRLWGNFTGQKAYNQERFISIVKLIIYLQKSLRPTLETFLEEPNDVNTWKRIYYTVRPFLDSLVNKRALYSYQWLGDQDVKNMNELAINNAADVQMGKYRVRLNIKSITSIQDITVDIVMTPTGLDFELVSNLI